VSNICKIAVQKLGTHTHHVGSAIAPNLLPHAQGVIHSFGQVTSVAEIKEKNPPAIPGHRLGGTFTTTSSQTQLWDKTLRRPRSTLGECAGMLVKAVAASLVLQQTWLSESWVARRTSCNNLRLASAWSRSFSNWQQPIRLTAAVVATVGTVPQGWTSTSAALLFSGLNLPGCLLQRCHQLHRRGLHSARAPHAAVGCHMCTAAAAVGANRAAVIQADHLLCWALG